MTSFSFKADKQTPGIIRIGQILHDSHEILNELPFRVWIQKYNREDDNNPHLLVEYVKDKNSELSIYETVHVENIFEATIDKESPLFTIKDNLSMKKHETDLLSKWIKDNHEPLLKLWDKKTVLIRHYPVRIEWFYD